MKTNTLAFDPDDLSVVPWARLESEPDEWFQRFYKYFLLMGPTRSLRKAFITFLKETEPETIAFYEDRPGFPAARQWTNACKEWQWRQRAREYDRAMLMEARSIVEEARKVLFDSAKEAADALRAALKDPRMRVAAAKEVLNRVGLPSQTSLDVSVRPYTSDEYNRAASEVDAWEKELLEQSASEKSG